MKKIYLLTLLLTLFGVAGMQAQRVYSDPGVIQNSTQNVVIYFDATGSPLANMAATTKLYAYTGASTNLRPTDWIGAGNWSDDKRQLRYVEPNLWALDIPDLRSYYGITNPDELITKLNFVFKTAGNNATQTKDLFLDVAADGLQVSITSNQGNVINSETAYVKLTLSSTMAADLTLSVDGETIATASNSYSLEKEYLFPTTGDYAVTGTAKTGDMVASETYMIYYLHAPQQVDYPGGTPKMGPVANADGSVTFCIGANLKDQVIIVGSWNDYAYTNNQVMNYQDTENGRYFWATIPNLDPNEMYLYWFVVDNQYLVGDPYARLVLDKNNDQYITNDIFPNIPAYPAVALEGANVPVAIYQGNINEYDWQCTDFQIPDKNNLTIYELLFRDFTGTEGKADGNGTVKKAIEKFPYLLDLGVNVIELLPIMEFNGNISWGYNPNFYFAIDKAYGTPDDYKEFIDLCHQNGIAVVLDMVFNQSDGLHPWYQMYDQGKNPYYNMNAPHAYSVLNDWNQGTAQVQEQWADVLRYWMTEYKFDGFRFDLVKGLGLNSSYPNNGDGGTNQYNASRVAEMLYLQSVMMEVNPDALFINENLATAKEENEMSNESQAKWGNMQLNWANVNHQGGEYAMGYPSNSNLNRFYAPNDDNRVKGSTISYLESHDEERLAYKQDKDGVGNYVKGNVVNSMRRLGSAAAQMLMAQGSHMIWQFAEMGNAQSTKNSNGGNNTDPKIVNWSLLNEPNHKGLYDNYCELIWIRNKNPEFFSNAATFTMNCSTTGWGTSSSTSTLRTLISTIDGKELITVVNPNYYGRNLTYSYAFNYKDNNMYKIMSKSYNSNPAFNATSGGITVEPNCYVVIGSEDLAGVEGIEAEEPGDAFMVWGGIGEVIVDHAPGIASVYSLDGRVVGKVNQSGSVAVSAGVYIVKSGKHNAKVIVR